MMTSMAQPASGANGPPEDKTWYIRRLIAMVRNGVPIGQALTTMDLPFDPELLGESLDKEELIQLLRRQDETRRGASAS
jgi:hypothetical protein